MDDLIRNFDENYFSKEKLDQIQKKLKIELPTSYIEFLTSFNGGYLIKDTLIVKKNNYHVFRLFGFTKLNYNDLDYNTSSSSMSSFPINFIPIGDNQGGDYYLLNLNEGNNYGKVYFWNHERSNQKVNNFG